MQLVPLDEAASSKAQLFPVRDILNMAACSPRQPAVKTQAHNSLDVIVVHLLLVELRLGAQSAMRAQSAEIDSVRAALKDTYDVDLPSADVLHLFDKAWLQQAVYPFSTRARLPAAGDKWSPANLRFAAYAQLTRLVLEAMSDNERERVRGQRLLWDAEGRIPNVIREAYPDA